MRRLKFGAWIGLVAAGTCLSSPALAQAPANAPPAVGVVKVTKHPVTETEQFIGRIQAAARVDVVARVTAYLEQVVFTEGARSRRATSSTVWSGRPSRPTSKPSRASWAPSRHNC